MKTIPDYPNYLISEDGKVFSLYTNKYLSPRKSASGYLDVSLSKDGKKKTIAIHRLVALTYIPNPNNLPQVNHKDENKLNNSVSNLEWCTASYNVNYGNRTAKSNKTLKFNRKRQKVYKKIWK